MSMGDRLLRYCLLPSLVLVPALLTQLTLGFQQPEPIRAEVEAVVVNVLVTDQFGRPIVGLKQEDFHVFEDKVEQDITNFFPVDAPFSVGLLLDTSYSAYGKLAQIQDSAIEFINQLHPDDEILVISFDDEVRLETDFTQNKDAAARAVKMTRTGQATALFDAVFLGMREINARPNRKVLVLFTDGIDTRSRDASGGETVKIAREAETTIYSVQFDTRRQAFFPQAPPLGTPPIVPGRSAGPLGMPGPFPGGGGSASPGQIEAEYQRGRSYLNELAKVTGGDLLEVRGDLSNLSLIFSQIVEEMRSLYSLSYVSTNPKRDGKFRRIVVKVDEAKARVRARKGYRAKKGS